MKSEEPSPDERLRSLTATRNALIAAAALMGAALIPAIATVVTARRDTSAAEREVTLIRQELQQTQAELASVRTDLQDALVRLRNISPTGNGSHSNPTAGEGENTSTAGTFEPKIVKKDGFSAAFNRCDRSGADVTCYIEITNDEEERILAILATDWFGVNSSRAIDDKANEYIASDASLGSAQGMNPKTVLFTNAPIQASVRFKGVKPDASQIRLLRLACDRLYFDFENVRIPAG